jgi:LPXTG-site transpeptidase (sortase) family protein
MKSTRIRGPRTADRRLIALAIACAAAAVAVLVVVVTRPPGGSQPIQSSSAIQRSSASPSATVPPSASPAASAPAVNASPRASGVVAVRIAVPKLGINLPIVEGDGMAAPIGRAAHFPGTAWPGAGSNTYLYGHAQEGMFLPLWQIQPGDQILLTLANDKKRCFAVDRTVPKAPWNDTSLLLPTDHEQLTLQTSTSYTPTAPRFVVIALPCA